MIDTITHLIAFGTLLVHILIIAGVISFFTSKKKGVYTWIGRYGVAITYLVALGAMIGSLFYSEIAGFEPCVLCWYQRIPMYAIVFIAGWALYKKDKHVIPYAIVLSWAGLVIAAYHNLLPFLSKMPVTCSPTSAVSCTEQYFTYFGYITIPMISLTAFGVMLLVLNLAKKYE